MYGLAAVLAWWTTQSLRAALNESYPQAGEFGQWLKQVARSISGDSQRKLDLEKGHHPTWGLPLVWRTRLGFYVAQPGFADNKTSWTGQSSDKKLTLHFTQMLELVDPKTQAQGLLPNLIHSLDATHLLMTVEQAASEGITRLGTIHDCLLCHPNEAEKVREIVRDTFAKLYAPDSESGYPHPQVLVDWYEWMGLLAEVARVERVTLFKGALKRPGGRSEKRLNEGERDLLAKVRALDEGRQRMIQALLDYRRDREMANQWEKKRWELQEAWKEKGNAEEEAARWVLDRLERQPARFQHPQSDIRKLLDFGGLAIGQVRQSPYFFN